jgi:hypothetical protein
VLASQIGYDLHASHTAGIASSGSNGHGSNGHGPDAVGSNGHASISGSSDDTSGDPTAASPIKRPVSVMERARLRLEKFYEAPRESAPETSVEDGAAPAGH